MDATLLLVLLPLAIASLASYARSEDILQTWANRRGYTLLSAQPRPFSRQTLYHVTLKDQHARTRRAWVTCQEGLLIGPLSTRIQVEWDD
jgi:hypothetical protein